MRVPRSKAYVDKPGFLQLCECVAEGRPALRSLLRQRFALQIESLLDAAADCVDVIRTSAPPSYSCRYAWRSRATEQRQLGHPGNHWCDVSASLPFPQEPCTGKRHARIVSDQGGRSDPHEAAARQKSAIEHMRFHLLRRMPKRRGR